MYAQWQICQTKTHQSPKNYFSTIHQNFSPPKSLPHIIHYTLYIIGVIAHCYWSKAQCTNTDHTDSSYLLQSIVPVSDISSSDVFYSLVYLIYLLLLSGDVELNPGPITGKHTLNTTLIN